MSLLEDSLLAEIIVHVRWDNTRQVFLSKAARSPEQQRQLVQHMLEAAFDLARLAGLKIEKVEPK